MSHWSGFLNFAATCAMSGVLLGCAGPVAKGPVSYAVLLASPDGSLGRVLVWGPGGEQVLTKEREGMSVNGQTAPFEVSKEQLERDFGAAMSARPALPEYFVLYFERGGSELTVTSQALLPTILEHARAHPGLDVSLIGHTDNLGEPKANEELARLRVMSVAEQIRKLGPPGAVIALEWHGGHDLLVPTADQTPEPGNRAVEVTLR